MTTIFWTGDSTVKHNTILTYPLTGIAQGFERFIKRQQVQIANFAENGRSTKQFIDEGRLAPIYDRMQAGDFLFIQFGHNDEKINDPARYADPKDAFGDYLERFVNVARNKGGYPVLITSVTRRLFRDPQAEYRHDAWAEAMRRTARRLDVPLVDLTRRSEALVDSLTDEESRRLYMNFPAGMYPQYPDGKEDNTHLRPAGALAFARLIARELNALGGVYADLLCDGFGQWAAEHPGFFDGSVQ